MDGAVADLFGTASGNGENFGLSRSRLDLNATMNLDEIAVLMDQSTALAPPPAGDSDERLMVKRTRAVCARSASPVVGA